MKPPLLIVCLGGIVSVSILSQVAIDPEPMIAQVVEVGIPLALTGGLFVTAREIRHKTHAGQTQARVLFLVSTLALVGIATLVLIQLTQVLEGNPITDIAYMVLMPLAVGMGIGGPIGLYYDEALTKRQQLVQQTERAQKLNQRLAVLHRVLRHNVSNELTVANAHLEQLLEHLEDETLRENLRDCQSALDDLQRHANKSLVVENLDGESIERDLVPLIEAIVIDITREHPEPTITVSTPDSAPVYCLPKIDVAIREALQNAIQHNDPTDLTIEITVTIENEWVVCDIADDGHGIPANERAVLTRDIESTLEHGTGVGLWVIKWIVKESNGTVGINDRNPEGTSVQLKLLQAAN